MHRLLSGAEGQAGRALRALVWRLAVHPSQQVGRLRYTELSVGYIAKAAGVGWETARQAWHRLRGVLGWASAPLARVRALGVRVRRLSPGGRWGQHLLLPASCAAACEALTARLGLGPTHRGEPTGPDWRVVTRVQRRGRYRMACCPWHDDRTPSLLLNSNSDGASGSGVCFACTDDQGQPLRVYWREHGGTIHARGARAIRQLSPATQQTGTIENLVGAEGVDRWVLAALRGGLMRRSESQCAGLLGLLRTADRRSLYDGAWGAAMHACATGDGPGQQYVSVDPMRAVAWRTLHTRRGEVSVPSRWGPVAVRWVLADLDGFSDAPVGDRGLALAGRALERWAQAQPLLSGRLAVVRTSHRGVQVVMELAEARGDPGGWYTTGEARALCRALDAAALRAVRAVGFQGGHADQSVHAAGRLMRRPGWRTDKEGTLCRSRLAWASDE